MKYLHLLCLLCIYSNAHSQIITTIAGNDTTAYKFTGDGGPATAARLNTPHQARPDGAGNVYFADAYDNRIRKVSAAGILTTVAGNGDTYCCDGMPATAAGIGPPSSVAVDRLGNLYISCPGNVSGGAWPVGGIVRKVDTAGIITTIAGGGTGGDGIPATASALNAPSDITIDRFGYIYVCEGVGGVRKIDTAGIISTIAGNETSGFSGDGGPATLAQLRQPSGIAVDDSGNVYIADEANSRIRKVDAMGIITTIAGDSTVGYSGDGGPATAAELSFAYGVAADRFGNVYIADPSAHRVRKIIDGIITTIAGDSTAGHTGDGGPATAAELRNPAYVSVDAAGNIFITDVGANDIRKISTSYITTSAPPQPAPRERQLLYIYPNPAAGLLTIDNPIANGATYYITDMPGRTLLSGSLPAGTQTITVNTLSPGSYIISLYDGNKKDYSKVFIKQ